MTLLHTSRDIRTTATILLALSILVTAGCTGLSAAKAGGGGTPPTPGSYTISGTIMPTRSATGTILTLSGTAKGSTKADTSGNYTFSGLANGSYTITPALSGLDFSPLKETVSVNGANVVGMDFTSLPSKLFSIHGTITPVGSANNATVTLSGTSMATTSTDGSGNYAFSGLANGSYTVTPANIEVIFTPYSKSAAVSGSDVNGVDFVGETGCSSGHGVANFYVGTNGNDSWSGTLDCPNPGFTDGPFASLARAQIAVEARLQGHPSSPTVVMVRDGTYYLPLSPTNPGTLHFTSSDSGRAAAVVTWENYPDEVPVVNGGIPLTGWTQVSGPLWQVQVPANTLPFEYLFYNGERRMRSRLQSAAGVGYYMSGGSCISSQSKQVVNSSQCNLGTFLRVAAVVTPTGANAKCPVYTNGTESKCLDRFYYNPEDPITNWINLNPPSGNPCKAPAAGNYPSGDVELTLFDAWTVDVMRISCVDTTTHIIYLTGPTQASTTAQYDFFAPGAGHRYVIDNTLDAFNAAQAAGQTGVWFLDRSTSPWTLNYLANATENPNTDTVVLPQLGGVFPGAPATDFVGSSLVYANYLSYLTFSGITFEMDNYFPSPTGFNNDRNEEFAVPQAIDCESCQNVVFDGVTIRHTSGSGITIASSASNQGPPATKDVIQNSAFYDMGSSGVRIGRHPLGGDLYPSVPQSLTVQNNVIQGFSRVFADGEGVAMGNGHDVMIQHNDVSDGYHAGIAICTGGCYSHNGAANGINITTQYNHIWNVMQGITSDNGALYYDIGWANSSGTGNQILNNLVHDVNDASIIDSNVVGSGYGAHGIYLDIESAGVNVQNNVLYRIGSGGLTMTEGPHEGKPANVFSNNIVAYARRAMFDEQNPWPENCTSTLKVKVTHNLFYFDLDDTVGFHAVGGCADSCGMTYNQFQNFQGNLYWRTDGGFASDANAFFVMTNPPPSDQASSCLTIQNPPITNLSFAQWQHGSPVVNGTPLPMEEDPQGTASVNPGFGNTGQATDFLLSNTPIAGFDYTLTDDTINNAGRNDPVIMPPTVPGTFPTYAYSKF